MSDINQANLINSNVDYYYAAWADITSDTTYCSYNKIHDALNDYDAAIKLNPKEAEYHVKKGWIYDVFNNNDKMLECANKALSITTERRNSADRYVSLPIQKIIFVR